MNVLVTGASGFVGRNFLLRAPADWRIVALYSRDDRFPEFVAGLHGRNVTAVRCDLADERQTQALVHDQGVEWESCLYLAGKVDIPWSVRAPKDDLLANTVPLVNLLGLVRVGRFVYFSSGAVYDGLTGEATTDAPLAPTLPYAISKLASEHYVAFHQQRRQTIDKYVIVRFFGAYGPYEAAHKIYTRLVRAFAIERKSHYTVYGDGSNLIDAMFVDDTVDAIVRIMTGPHWNHTINLAGGHPVRIEDLVRSVAVALGVPDVRIDKQGLANEKNEFWGSAREMQQLYGFQPRVPLTVGLSRLREFLEAAYHAG